MDEPTGMARIWQGKRYNVDTATLLADDVWWDGNNFERRGRNTFLYVTPGGAYFRVDRTMWQGEQDTLTPIDQDKAIELYEGPLCEHYVEYEDAFPNVDVVDATGPGAPRQMEDGRPVNVRLGINHIEIAKSIGDGNISAGVRRALVFVEEMSNKD